MVACATTLAPMITALDRTTAIPAMDLDLCIVIPAGL
jgi:hypothetical protein